MNAGFQPPPYPYDRLDPLKALAAAHEDGLVDLSVGTPCDPPSAAVVTALGASGTEAGYPASIGSAAFRVAAAGWLERRFGVGLDPSDLAACVGTKEFVANVPHILRLRDPQRDTVLYPAVSYPTYAMGALLAGCRAVPVAVDESWHLDISSIDDADARRALCLWVNTPANPTGAVDDLGAAAAWGREHGVPVFSDECYVEFTWSGARHTILEHGLDGLVAVHSLSKRSNMAGLRAGFYAGDRGLVRYLAEVRKHVGLMMPGPAQLAASVALEDDAHLEKQRERYRVRLGIMREAFAEAGVDTPFPEGTFYLWVAAPEGDAWAFTERLAKEAGVLVSPGEFYGSDGAGYVRVAVVQPTARLERAADRISAMS
ncbi:MAG: succinyldiaminopimelate transaminase [Acidimicrobiia bacterium]|nr:succinyldiaminopimelate transaminase [Acidimicrobiia bacterium]MBV9041991.1 succinyldiaminopimelate transaminase [Acidimicrobiia bacterium]